MAYISHETDGLDRGFHMEPGFRLRVAVFRIALDLDRALLLG